MAMSTEGLDAKSVKVSSPFTEAQNAMEMAEALCRDMQDMIDALIGQQPVPPMNDPGHSSSIGGMHTAKTPTCSGRLGDLEAQAENLRRAVNRTYGYISRVRAVGVL